MARKIYVVDKEGKLHPKVKDEMRDIVFICSETEKLFDDWMIEWQRRQIEEYEKLVRDSFCA